MALGLLEFDHFLARFIPQLEVDAGEALAHCEGAFFPEGRDGFVARLEHVVRYAGVQMVASCQMAVRVLGARNRARSACHAGHFDSEPFWGGTLSDDV